MKDALSVLARRHSGRWRASPVGHWPRPTSLDEWDHIAADSVEQADRWVARSFPFGRYVIFCELIADAIDVVRVVHRARDMNAVVGEER